jgi:hypothetical protein
MRSRNSPRIRSHCGRCSLARLKTGTRGAGAGWACPGAVAVRPSRWRLRGLGGAGRAGEERCGKAHEEPKGRARGIRACNRLPSRGADRGLSRGAVREASGPVFERTPRPLGSKCCKRYSPDARRRAFPCEAASRRPGLAWIAIPCPGANEQLCAWIQRVERKCRTPSAPRRPASAPAVSGVQARRHAAVVCRQSCRIRDLFRRRCRRRWACGPPASCVSSISCTRCDASDALVSRR